jgi:hypothetical protein
MRLGFPIAAVPNVPSLLVANPQGIGDDAKQMAAPEMSKDGATTSQALARADGVIAV